MEVFKPIKVENEEWIVYFKDDEEEGKVLRKVDLKNPKKKGFRISN